MQLHLLRAVRCAVVELKQLILGTRRAQWSEGHPPVAGLAGLQDRIARGIGHTEVVTAGEAFDRKLLSTLIVQRNDASGRTLIDRYRAEVECGRRQPNQVAGLEGTDVTGGLGGAGRIGTRGAALVGGQGAVRYRDRVDRIAARIWVISCRPER